MISIITPLSDTGTPYIRDLYRSLCAQRVQKWEWIVLQNKGGYAPMETRSDPRVKLHREEHEGIGALKRRCCALASGDLIVEVDHDDLLVPDALTQIRDAFTEHVDFVYSDFVEFESKTWRPNVYSSAYGWETYDISYEGHALKAMRAPALTPQNMRSIMWAPNHVRAWTKASYDKLGGHDSSFPIADDFDLVSRYYLAAPKRMRYLAQPLYLYRVHDLNNVKTQNANIRRHEERVYNKTIWSLAERFATLHDLAKIDLCGAIDSPEGYTPYDLALGHDLNASWPIRDDSVGVLRAYDAIEHLRDPVHTMSEAYRVLAPGGFFMISVPSTNGLGAFCDPTHVSFWNRLSFRYYTDRQYQRYIPHFKGRFQIARLIEWFPSAWHQQENVPYVEVQMLALKPGYEPMGEILI